MKQVEPTDEMLVMANLFWENARLRVLDLAAEMGRADIPIAEHDDTFLMELFDYGERVPSSGEIVRALEEYAHELEEQGIIVAKRHSIAENKRHQLFRPRWTHTLTG